MLVMNEYWLSLNMRDRLALSICASVLFIYFGYLFIFNPLFKAIDKNQELLIEKKETLAWMKKKLPKLKNTKSVDNNLMLTLSQQLKTTSFSSYPYQLQQTKTDEILLSFENVPYVQVMSWLNAFMQKKSINIVELTISETKTPGVVKFLLRIKKGN